MKLPAPWRITFDTNPDDCNLNCIMCERFSVFAHKGANKRRRMSFSIIEQVISEAAPLGLREVIPSTIGEPLLYARFQSLIDLCRQQDIMLNVTTNGTWPRFGPRRWAEALCPIATDVKVSWNGASPRTQEMIMPGSKFERRLDDLVSFISVRDEIASAGLNRCGVTLQCTFMESNLEELPDLIQLASRLGVDRVKGHHLWVHTDEMTDESLRRSLDSRRRWNSTVAECVSIVEKNPRNDGSLVKLVNFTPLPELGSSSVPDSWICPFLGKEAWINAEGRFDPCCAPDSERRSLGYFGTVDESEGLKAIWNGEKYCSFTRNPLNYPVCKKCNMRRPPEEMR